MPLFQVTRRELVNVDRTYEIEASEPRAAVAAIDSGELVSEQMQDTHGLRGILRVTDEDGNELEH